MSKKYTVIHDLEDFKLKNGDGGMYAILPYERLDKHGKAMFKVGMAEDFRKRFEQYHTYYPLGFYYKDLLANPRANRKDSQGKRMTEKAYYNKVEKFIHDDIKENGGKQLITTTRIKNSKAYGERGGESEWFYTNEKTLDKAFDDAHNKFGGTLPKHKQSLSGINRNATENARGASYKAEIYYHV